MEAGSWEVIKTLISWVVYPIIGLLSYLFKRQSSEISMLQVDIANLKIEQAVANSQIRDIREDIKDLTNVVREAERTITDDIKVLRRDILDARQNNS